uniref:Uncharacterized protein n=1 Tax=Mola mola TaxID=94237 RepID=A0A3Q3X727_MOLML
MSVQFCLVLLALSSLTAASDPDCDKLLKPLEDQNLVLGKWIFLAGSSDNKETLGELQSINSSWIEISLMAGSDEMTLRWGDKMDGKCHYGGINFTFSANATAVTFTFNSTTHEHVGMYLVTCPDCIVWMDTFVTEGIKGETRRGRNLYLFTKNGTLDDSHLEAFKKQAGCLSFPTDFHFGGTTGEILWCLSAFVTTVTLCVT